MLLDRRLIFVTGKGGVGKTTVAAGLATVIAASGRRTLIVEMDHKGSVADAFGVAPFGYAPVDLPIESSGPADRRDRSAPLAEVSLADDSLAEVSLAGMQMNTEDSLREYLRTVMRIPLVGRIGPLARTFDFVADAAPGVKEILSIGKVLSDIRTDAWDTIVVDAEATGHVLAQVAAPSALRELIKVGAVHDQTGWMLELLHDPAITSVAVVTTPEELAVNEALELVDRLPDEAGIRSTVVVVNRALPALFNRRQSEVLDQLGGYRTELSARFGAGIEPLLDAALVAEQRRRNGVDQLQRIAARGLPTLVIGEYFGSIAAAPTDLVDHVAKSLASELDVDAPDRYLPSGDQLPDDRLQDDRPRVDRPLGAR